MDTGTETVFSYEKNMRLIELAHECVFINSAEKEKTIKLLEEKIKQGVPINVLEIFEQEEYVSSKRIERLLALDAHLKVQNMDQQFGRLAVANDLASEEDVAEALRYQKRFFEKNKISLSVADVLVDNKTISPEDRISILLTQNRIKNENLAEALSQMGRTQIQKEAVNKRFGAIAIKKQYATIDQVNAALEIQKKKKQESDESVFIGQILQETIQLSDEQIQDVLLEQKQFEKRRLDLEKALYTVKSEMRISKKLNKLFDYSISKDGLEAFAKKKVEIDQAIPVYELIIWLRRVGIQFGIVDDNTLEEFIEKAKPKDEILVARGIASAPCKDEQIQIFFENDFFPVYDSDKDPDKENALKQSKERSQEQSDSDVKTDTDKEPSEKSAELEDASASDGTKEEDQSETASEEKQEQENNKEKKSQDQKDDAEMGQAVNGLKDDQAHSVKRGAILARIVAGAPGRPGKDVLGHVIQPGQPKACTLNAGAGVIRKDSVFVAIQSGHPFLKNGTTLVVDSISNQIQEKTINGSLSSDTSDTYAQSAVQMNGDIALGATLTCQTLFIQGNIMGVVTCNGDMTINGQVGTDELAADNQEKYQTQINCQGSVKASKTITNARIQAGGTVQAFNSSIIGAELIVYKNLAIKDALNGENGPCVLRFGLRPGGKVLALDHTIEKKRAYLSELKKEAQIQELTDQYEKDLQEEENHQQEQAVFKCLIEIVEGPELYQHETLGDKIKYLYNLPDFSSIKTYYLAFPKTNLAFEVVSQMVAATEKMSMEDIVKFIKKKLDPEPEATEKSESEEKNETQEESDDSTAVSNTMRIEIEFNARLAAIKQEVSEQKEEIEKLEKEIDGLKLLRKKFEPELIRTMSNSPSTIKIKNKCEQGTIIKGKVAQRILEKTLYHVTFKEVVDPKDQSVAIVIDT
jgi:uncharacterized protein (DUF342 family)